MQDIKLIKQCGKYVCIYVMGFGESNDEKNGCFSFFFDIQGPFFG